MKSLVILIVLMNVLVSTQVAAYDFPTKITRSPYLGRLTSIKLEVFFKDQYYDHSAIAFSAVSGQKVTLDVSSKMHSHAMVGITIQGDDAYNAKEIRLYNPKGYLVESYYPSSCMQQPSGFEDLSWCQTSIGMSFNTYGRFYLPYGKYVVKVIYKDGSYRSANFESVINF